MTELKQSLLQLKIPWTCTKLHQMRQLLFWDSKYNLRWNCYYCIRARKKVSVNFKWWILWKQSFLYRLPKDKYGYNAPRDIPTSPAWYFNQRLLNFNQNFASDADYIFFARSVYEQYHLCLSINLMFVNKRYYAHN